MMTAIMIVASRRKREARERSEAEDDEVSPM
jgi:hypothetical protein